MLPGRSAAGPGCFQALADTAQVGCLSVADGDHEVFPGEHVDLAELDPLGVIEVAGRAQHDEQGGVIALQLRTLMGGDRVLDGQRVQFELAGD